MANLRTKQKDKWLRGRKYSKYDTWDLFVVFAADIHKGLTLFKRTNVNSYPGRLGSMEEWHKIIDEMIWTFNELRLNEPGNPHMIDAGRLDREIKIEYGEPEGAGVPIKIIDNCTPKEKKRIDEETEAYYKRIENGLNLFAEYFRDLWD